MTDLSAVSLSGAKLPLTYQAAKKAISECASVDECKDWSDKAAALASYAKQAQDVQLENMAKRIRARATRRAGELLKQIPDGRQGQNLPNLKGEVAPDLTRAAVAAAAGLTEHQERQARRVAEVRRDDFEEMVESGATLTQIAAAGTQKREPNRDEAKKLLAIVHGYSDRLSGIDMDEALASLTVTQRTELRMLVTRLDGLHDRMVTA